MSVLTQPYILIMGGGILTVPMYEKCRNLGLKICAFEWNLDAPALPLADRVEKVNLKNIEDVRKKTIETGKKIRISGVVTCGADLEIAVAAAAETLSLPGIPVSVAALCNDKTAMRQKLREQGLEDTAWFEATSPEQAESAAAKIGFPCFIKPVDNCGSRGCRRMESPEDIRQWWDEALKFSVNSGDRILVEEYQDGPRQTVEMIVENGTPHLVSIIDTHYIYEEPDKYPYGHWPVETGLHMTTQPKDVQKRLFEHASKVVKAMGVNWGPVKVDTTLSPKGVQTVELTARLSGGFHCQYATPLAYGTDEITAVAKMAIGQPLDRELIRRKYDRAAVVWAKFPEPGIITRIGGLDQARSIPGIHEVFVFKSVGDEVPSYRNSTDRVAFVIADGDSLAAAKESAQKALDTLVIETRPAAGGLQR